MEKSKSFGFVNAIEKISRSWRIDVSIVHGLSCCTIRAGKLELFYHVSFSLECQNGRSFPGCCWITGCPGASSLNPHRQPEDRKRTKCLFGSCVLCHRAILICLC